MPFGVVFPIKSQKRKSLFEILSTRQASADPDTKNRTPKVELNIPSSEQCHRIRSPMTSNRHFQMKSSAMNALNPKIAILAAWSFLFSAAHSETECKQTPSIAVGGKDQVEVVFQSGSGLAFDPDLDAVWCDEPDQYHLSGIPFFATLSWTDASNVLVQLLDENMLGELFPELSDNPESRRKEALRFAVFAFSDLYETEDTFSRFFFATNAANVKQDETCQTECVLDKLSRLGFFDRSENGFRTAGVKDGGASRVFVGNANDPFVLMLDKHWVGPRKFVLLPSDLTIPGLEKNPYARSPERRRFKISPSDAFSTGEVRFNGKTHLTYLMPESRKHELNDIQFVQELVRLGHVSAMESLFKDPAVGDFWKDYPSPRNDSTIPFLCTIALEEMSRHRHWSSFLAEYYYGSDVSSLPEDDDTQISKLVNRCLSGGLLGYEHRIISRLRWTKDISADSCLINVIDAPVIVWSLHLEKRWVGPDKFMWVVSEFGPPAIF